MDVNEKALKLHYEMKGKIEVVSRKSVETREDLSLLYTPGVAEPCRQIAADEEKSYPPLQPGRRNHGRNGCPGSWRYRAGCRNAGDGRKMCTV